MTFIKPSEIKTLNQLYQLGELVVKKPTSVNKRYSYNEQLLDRISLIQGDITKLEIDAIVNAANRRLLGGGGVDGAIHRAAGPRLYQECKTLNGCETGQSKMTKGYSLPSSHVIHTVGPIYYAESLKKPTPSENEHEEGEGRESGGSGNTDETTSNETPTAAQLLRSCYQTSLELAVANSLKHIAFPCISTGIYGYPIYEAAHIALDTVRQFLEEEGEDETLPEESEGEKQESGPNRKRSVLERVIFVVFLDKDKQAYRTLLPEYFPPPPEQSEGEEIGEGTEKEKDDSTKS